MFDSLDAAQSRLIVVAETGSSVESWSSTASDRGEQLLVICQELGEGPDRFVERTRCRLKRLSRSELPPSRAVLALHADPERTMLKARSVIALALLGALPRETGDLVISAPRVLTAEGERQLWTMLDELIRSAAARY